MPKKKKLRMIEIDAEAEYTQTIADDTAFNGSEQDSLTTVTVHQNAYLMGIQFSGRFAATALAKNGTVELSRSGNYQGNTSDNPDTLMVIQADISGLTSGATQMAQNVSIRTNIFFRAGDKIYLNQFGDTGVGAQKIAVLFWRFHETELG